jgi:hypothetical protein
VIRVTLKVHRDAVEVLEREGFRVEPVRFSRGDHLIVGVSKGGRSGRITLAGSPSSFFLRNVVKSARRAVTEEREWRK